MRFLLDLVFKRRLEYRLELTFPHGRVKVTHSKWTNQVRFLGLVSTSIGLDWTWLASNQVHLDLVRALLITLSDLLLT